MSAAPARLLVLGRAGLDLYPLPDGCKTRDAQAFSADLGGSAGNIAVAAARAGGRAALISGLSADAVGDFVRARLEAERVDTSLIATTSGGERTSLAIAEVRAADCEVVIYRNDAADLAWVFDERVRAALTDNTWLVVTGTCLVAESSRAATLALMTLARERGCPVWFDLDYRAWNWPDAATTRAVYREAAAQADLVVGNDEEFAVLGDDFDDLRREAGAANRVLLLKRGADGSTLYADGRRLDCGIVAVDALKPYGSGDAFLGNLLVSYAADGDWRRALIRGSAAAALVVSRRGCAAAMPTPDEIDGLLRARAPAPAAEWS